MGARRCDGVGAACEQPVDELRGADPGGVVEQRPLRRAADDTAEARPDGVEHEVELCREAPPARSPPARPDPACPAAAPPVAHRARSRRRRRPPGRPRSRRRAVPAAVRARPCRAGRRAGTASAAVRRRARSRRPGGRHRLRRRRAARSSRGRSRGGRRARRMGARSGRRRARAAGGRAQIRSSSSACCKCVRALDVRAVLEQDPECTRGSPPRSSGRATRRHPGSRRLRAAPASAPGRAACPRRRRARTSSRTR